MFEQFEFATQIDRLSKNGLLYQVTERSAEIDLHRDRADNNQIADRSGADRRAMMATLRIGNTGSHLAENAIQICRRYEWHVKRREMRLAASDLRLFSLS